jgi:hypothetical protein
LKPADIHTYTSSISLNHSFIITKQASKTFDMSFLRIAAISTFVSAVSAHGVATGIVADGKYHAGWSQNFLYQSTHPDVVGWGVTYEDTGFVGPDAYASADIICHKGVSLNLNKIPKVY